MLRIVLIVSTMLLVPANVARSSDATDSKIAFNRDIRPLLARNCFPCHGPDESSRQGELRLDKRTAAIGVGAIDIDDFAASPLVARLHTDDPDLVMPPVDSGKSLTLSQRRKISAWVASGAKYDSHWSFIPPVQAGIPEPLDSWSHSPIDQFLMHEMRNKRLRPAPPADRYTLVRRLYQDLLGVLPTFEETHAFVADELPDAYERLVDRLLASPQYGEHMARAWLDLARYADTNGYEKDRPRSIWPYRDWVIHAINEDMPFDQFTIEQLAGDMLPNATLSQKIATGFHRNTMLNEEGGIDPLEYRFYAMVDRVATTGTVWMGLTIGCAQCHTHKYDPITHSDYYRMMALLDNADEPDLLFRADTTEMDATLATRHRELESALVERASSGDLQDEFSEWVKERKSHASNWITAKPIHLRSNLPKLERLSDDSVFATGDFTKRDEYFIELQIPAGLTVTALRLEALPDDRLPAAGPGRTFYEGRQGQFFLSEMDLTVGEEVIPVAGASYSHTKELFKTDRVLVDGDGSTGWSNGGRAGERHVAVLNFEEPLKTERVSVRLLFERHFVAALGRLKFSAATTEHPRAFRVEDDVEELLSKNEVAWTPSERQKVSLGFVRTADSLSESRKKIEQLRKRLEARDATLVMQERPSDNPRTTHRHHRGEWLAPRESVTGAVPAIFPQLPAEQSDRLGLARWLVSEQNPLFARVLVNRAWRRFMGAGLVRSDGDFGTQSSLPTHPELLDWLACEFTERGMSRKWLHRQIVTSAAYRQRSSVTANELQQDPQNRYFARGPRHRVSGEAIRDMLLSASNSLSRQVGGPSVRPPQPDSVTQIAYGNPKWNASTGEDRVRRSLYTFSKRTAPFAAFTTFDGPSGELCVARRNRSNTPLQALTLLNDEMFVEMARQIGRSVYQIESNVTQQIEVVFFRLLTRPPLADEMNQLERYYATQLSRLQDGELSASMIGANKETTAELAALIMVSRIVMNLDEMVTKH